MNKFLNRLLGCPVHLQNAIFTFFSDVLAAVILEAKRTGKWDMGILDLGSGTNEVAYRNETRFFILNLESHSKKVEMHTILVERGLIWEEALEIYKQYVQTEPEPENIEDKSLPADGFYVSNQVKNNHRIPILVVSAKSLCPTVDDSYRNDSTIVSFYRPNTGLQVRQETRETLLKKYKRVSPQEVKLFWDDQYHKSAHECTHVYRQGHCANLRMCEIGLRTRTFNVLAGSVLTVWNRVENVLSSLTGYSQFRLQIIRVKTNDDCKIIGCCIPTACLSQIVSLLESMSIQTYTENHLTLKKTKENESSEPSCILLDDDDDDDADGNDDDASIKRNNSCNDNGEENNEGNSTMPTNVINFNRNNEKSNIRNIPNHKILNDFT
jgi:hypothetical protein